uniref:ATP synthase complex subunit 8 n=1 Tax=Condylostylus luteicoxa TaxID=2984119 RepID=A0A977TPU3_9MUSC|nr:ATP synthase F0 subunit 8 [Condylostylus luteicoxa]UXX49968.1 ATP synthase F0 subunit 8 [Condylostylus luteicoxa]
MPQMAPLSWLSLYIMFTITLIMFCMMNYYIFIPNPPKTFEKSKTLPATMNWKW